MGPPCPRRPAWSHLCRSLHGQPPEVEEGQVWKHVTTMKYRKKQQHPTAELHISPPFKRSCGSAIFSRSSATMPSSGLTSLNFTHMVYYSFKISFGGIPNSRSIDILMPYAIFDYMGGVLPMWTMVSPWSKQAHGCSCQGCKATNHTGTFRNLRNPATPTGRNLPPILPPEPTPTHAGTLRLRNLPRPSAPTHASIHRNPPKSSGTFRHRPPEPDLHHFTPELSGTFHNLSRTYTSIRRNSPEPSGTCLRNLHQHTPELSGTFRNPSPEPTPAYAGTFRNLPEPEPASGTTPAYAGTFRNLPEPPCGTYSSTPQNPLEPSGTFLRNLLLRPAPAHTGAYLGWRPH